MSFKGFTDKNSNMETPIDVIGTEKPLKKNTIINSRVDINVLKSKLQEKERKELKKSIIILTSLILSLGALGIYISF